ncbi:MAG: GNAT family N-acetyltransferase [Oscillatoriales cyanobacterium C42_A2020_001]|nr:GNAT family N-acetyltransferase [Leptolyngbyaceae cyanobacterium C42_A2020_001]
MQPITIQLRAATIADLDQILMFIHQKAAFDGFRDPIVATPELLKQTLFSDRPCAEVAFAEVDTAAVGFVLFSQTYSSFLAQQTIWIDDLFVQAHWRRQGVGSALVSYVAQIAKSRNCGRIEWTVATTNANGIAFYQQLGAQIREEVRLCRMTAPAIAKIAIPL